jgi:hypothetical protein
MPPLTPDSKSRLIREMVANCQLPPKRRSQPVASSTGSNHGTARNNHSVASSTGFHQGTVRKTHSVASSTGSNHGTVSADSTISTTFDPDRDEAIVSTYRLNENFSQKLPELRDTAKKYNAFTDRWSPKRPDTLINTSAIGRAFPDFTQGGSSDDNFSIELARGPKTRRSPANPRVEYSGNVNSPIVTIGDYKITGTPQRESATGTPQRGSALKGSVGKAGARLVSQKENIPPPNSQEPAKGLPYFSNASRAISGQQRTLTEMYARVTAESDDSFISDQRPDQQPIPTPKFKDTRFGGSHITAKQAAATFAEEHLERKRAKQAQSAVKANFESKPTNANNNAQSKPAQNTTISTTPNPTQQSFLLPNVQEISHVVSNSYNNGVPVVSRGGVVQPRQAGTSKYPHEAIDGIDLADDEEDIYLSIDLLKSRVAQLESEKAESQKVIEDLQRHNYELQIENQELKKRRRADSALGDSGSDGGSNRESQHIAEKSSKFKIMIGILCANHFKELEARVVSLQSLLDASKRKVSTQNIHLESNTAERDLYKKQFAHQTVLNEQLQTENDDIRQENQTLRDTIAQFVSQAEEDTRNFQKEAKSFQREKESIRAQFKLKLKEEEALKAELANKEQAVQKTQQEVESLQNRLAQVVTENAENAQIWQQKEYTLLTQTQRADTFAQEVQEATQELEGNTRETNFSLSRKEPPKRSNRAPRAEHQSVGVSKSIDIEEIEDENLTRNTTIHHDMGVPNNQEGDTLDGSAYESICGPGFMANLRQAVRDSRILKKRVLEAAAAQDETTHTVRSVRSAQSLQSARSSHAPLVKSAGGILKNRGAQSREEDEQEELTGRLSVKSTKSAKSIGQHDNHTTRSDISRSHQRHKSDSALHTRTRRRRDETDDMTSAFLLPDISVNAHRKEHPRLSASARRVLDGLCQHESRNCSVCTRVASFDTKTQTKHKVNIIKPIPVTDRKPDTAPYEDEPTIRPSMDPGLALATVIQSLEDEVAKLKERLAKVETAYNLHEIHLGMRKRKALKERIDELFAMVETKSNQVYWLYDVLEGQKTSGQLMTEEEVEVTLLELGIKKSNISQGTEDSGEVDLPWEGIEESSV